MNKGIVITNPIYPKAVVVFRGDSKKKMFKFFKESFPEKHHVEIEKGFKDTDYIGLTLILDSGDVLIHLTNEAGTGTIVHECFHATEFLFEKLGLEFHEPPNEPYAYYLAFLTKAIVNNLYE